MGSVSRFFVRTMGAAQTELYQCIQKREGFHASLICYHARLVKVKNVSVGVSERQALSNLIRFSRSRDPIMKYDSLSTLMSPVDVSASLAGLEHCRDVPLFAIISGGQRSENRLKHLVLRQNIIRLNAFEISSLQEGKLTQEI